MKKVSIKLSFTEEEFFYLVELPAKNSGRTNEEELMSIVRDGVKYRAQQYTEFVDKVMNTVPEVSLNES